MSNVFWNEGNGFGRSVLQRLGEQFSSQSDWKQRLSRCELPDDVCALIRSVTQQTRLLRYEKAEIADELIAHFEDGHRRGKSYDRLVEDFGEAETTAKLIRNSKLRSRPMLMKIGRGAGWLGAGSLVAYLVAMVFFHMAKPNPTVDYQAMLNERIEEIPDDDKAWLLYREPWTNHEFSEGLGGRFTEIYEDLGDGRYCELLRPGDDGWDKATQKLADSQDLLNAFREARYKKALGVQLHIDFADYSDEDYAALFPARVASGNPKSGKVSLLEGVEGIPENAQELMNGSMFGILLPHIQSFRKAARIMTVDTAWAIEQDDSERATQNLEAMFAFANQVSENDFLVSSLVGIAICGITYDFLDEILIEYPDFFSEEELARIQTAVESNDIVGFTKFSGEHASCLDFIQRVYSDDGEGDGRITPDGLDVLVHSRSALFQMGPANPEDADLFDLDFQEVMVRSRKLIGPAALLVMASRKEIVEELENHVAHVEAEYPKPFWEGFDLHDGKFETTEFAALGMIVPAWQQIKAATERTRGNQNGMIMTLAAYRFKKLFGQFPDTAEDLTLELLDKLPVDQVTGKPLHYRITDDGFTVYSVGLDMDDDGGVAIDSNNDGLPDTSNFFNFYNPGEKVVDGDWVLWPRNVERD